MFGLAYSASGLTARSQLRADCPEVWEGRLVERGREVLGPRGSSRAWLCPDGALDHLHVPVPPLLEPLVQVHQALADGRYSGVRPIDRDQDLLHLAWRLRQLSHIPSEERR